MEKNGFRLRLQQRLKQGICGHFTLLKNVRFGVYSRLKNVKQTTVYKFLF